MGAGSVNTAWIPEPAIVRRQTDRILSSELFRGSPIQCRLFRYVIEQTLEGGAGGLKEYTLGSAVFQRGDSFDPRNDSIVRVQVGVLRKKLAAYYEGPGIADDVLIEIPRGHYAPHFTQRLLTDPSAPLAVPPRPLEPAVAPRAFTGQLWLLLLAGIVIGLAAMWIVDQVRLAPAANPGAVTVKSATAFEWRDHPVWKGFFEPGASTKLVMGVPLMVGFGGILVRDTMVNRPEDIALSRRLHDMEVREGRKGLPQELYTGLGEASGINVLTRFFLGASQDLPLIRNRLTKWQDLAAGNLIFLASLRFRTLGQELDRPTDFRFEGLPDGATLIRNLKPQSGEALIYQPQMTNGNAGYDYALVTVSPGTLSGRRLMTIGGSHTWGTEGAVEYITDGPSLRELRERVGDGGGNKAPLQILLKVEVKDSQVVSTGYVTHHWLK